MTIFKISLIFYIIFVLISYRKNNLNWIRKIVYFVFTVIHEISHAIVGLVMGKGISTIVLKPSELVDEKGQVQKYAGYYQGKYRSFLRLGPIRIGDALTNIAGYIVPPLILITLTSVLQRGFIQDITLFFVIGLIFLFIVSAHKIIPLILIVGLGLLVYSPFPYTKEVLDSITYVLVLMISLSLIEGFISLSTYIGPGSDTANFTYNLIRIRSKFLSRGINLVIQLYYVWILYISIF